MSKSSKAKEVSATKFWKFRELAADEPFRGSRQSFAITRKIHNLVREAIQNIRDQGRSPTKPVSVSFKIFDLVGDAKTRFLADIGWNQGLHTHIAGCAKSQDVAEKQLLIDNLEKFNEGLMRVLIISDSETKGLTGQELGTTGNFCKLCRNEMIPTEGTGVAANGGAFGVGKSAYWSFSGFDTVVFSSRFIDEETKLPSSRVFGRTYLPDHQLDGGDARSFSGDGYLCKPGLINGKDVGLSLKFEEANISKGSLLYRDENNFGTTIAIVMFDEQIEDQNRAIDELANNIRDSIVVNFWPLLDSGLLKANIEWSSGESSADIKVGVLKPFEPFVRAANVDRDKNSLEDLAKGTLLDAGQCAYFENSISIPKRKGGKAENRHDKIEGIVSVGVTCLTENELEDLKSFQEAYKDVELVDRFAYMRSARMVVDYRLLVEGNCSKHVGVVRAGTARGEDLNARPDDSDLRVEMFLRDSEPPMHDHWFFFDKVSSNYAKPWREVVRNMFESIATTAKKILRPNLFGDKDRPDGLADLLRIKGPGDEIIPPGGNHIGVRSRLIKIKFDIPSKKFTCDVEVQRVDPKNKPRSRDNWPPENWSANVGTQAVGEVGRELLTHLAASSTNSSLMLKAESHDSRVVSYVVTAPWSVKKYLISFEVSLDGFSDALLERIRVTAFAESRVTS